MNNNKFFKVYTNFEIFKYNFENGFSVNKSYVDYIYDYCGFGADEDKKQYIFHCCECGEHHNIEELTFKNQKIICKCGAKFSADDLKPHVSIWESSYKYMEHNILNNTFNKVSVPTILSKEWFYCPKCRTTHKLRKMPIENKQRVCTCGETYAFENCKLTNAENFDYTSGNIYFDGHKITISFMEYYTSVNRLDNFFWQEGSSRLTMNLETGYSYTTNTGACYTFYNKFHKERYDKNAPKMFNSTYTVTNTALETVATARRDQLLMRYKDNENLFKLILRNQGRTRNIIFKRLFKEIDEYMTNYYNNKFSYRIKSLTELIIEDQKLSDERNSVNFGENSTRKVRKQYGPGIYDSNLLSLHNRFINVPYRELKHVLSDILLEIRSMDKRNYKVLSRETNNIGLDYICGFVNVSKKLRKKINAYLEDLLKVQRFSFIGNSLYTFVNITRFFKNKENINKIYETIMNGSGYSFRYDVQEGTMKLWMQYRNEQYISNLSYKELHEKAGLMDDARRTILSIRNVLGEDWDLNTIKFHTEEQFHDDLVRITTSDDFIELVNKEKEARALVPFEMEDEVFDLEEIENDFYIAKNRAILTNIGQAMGICVGGYGGSVESGRCRIAYLKENGIYKVCIELAKHKNKETNKMEYTIVQAKLQYNKLAAEDDKYYNLVMEWATRNNIAIDTYDMERRQKRTAIAVPAEI